jgi:hypothetical protein
MYKKGGVGTWWRRNPSGTVSVTWRSVPGGCPRRARLVLTVVPVGPGRCWLFLFGAKERRVEGKRDGRGSLTAGRNGPGRRRSGKAGVASQWEGTGQEEKEKAGWPGFPHSWKERARGKRAGCQQGRKRSRSWRLVRKLDWKQNEDRNRNRNRNELCRLGAVLLLPWLRHGGTARGRRLAAGAVGELGSVRSPGIVGRKKHGFRGGFGGRGHGSCLRANFLPRLGERTEFFRHREHFLVTSLQILDANFYYCIESVI